MAGMCSAARALEDRSGQVSAPNLELVYWVGTLAVDLSRSSRGEPSRVSSRPRSRSELT